MLWRSGLRKRKPLRTDFKKKSQKNFKKPIDKLKVLWYNIYRCEEHFTSHRCGFSSFGRARPCQGRGGGFEPRNPLHFHRWSKIRLCSTVKGCCALRLCFLQQNPAVVEQNMAPWPSGKARVCKTLIPRFKSGWRLQKPSRTKFGKVFTFSLFTLHFSLNPSEKAFGR